MYLSEQIVDFNGQSWSMVGAIPTTAVMSSRLTLGYRCCTALEDSLLLRAGGVVWGHEFHRSHLLEMPTNPVFEIRGYEERSPTTLEGWRSPNIHASYIHLHFGGRSHIPQRFLEHCLHFRQSF